MVENDPCETERDVDIDVVDDLRSEGYTEAEEVGAGGFGRVYRCLQTVLDRTVAVKVLTVARDEDRDRFFREQRAMARLTDHPNIVDILAIGETPSGRPYLVMPYYAGGSLDSRIRRNGSQPVSDALRIGIKVAGALETAHRAGILHRDVKPGNILLSEYEEPALTDFGIARIAGGFETAAGTIVGSPAFTPPEVLNGEVSSRSADVYGLGATLFCMLTGHAPFERHSGERVVAQFARISQEPVPVLPRSDFPADLCALIEAAMAHDPHSRPTAGEFGERLEVMARDAGLMADRMALQYAPDEPAHPRSSPAPASGTVDLPLELTSFVGRRLEVAKVKSLVAAARLVTLTGIGGVGKSRLALRVAHSLSPGFAGDVRLVELGDLRDSSLTVEVVASALGLRDYGGRSLADALTQALARRRMLIVLDNCEHVIETVARLAESLLRGCSEVRLMVTSREPLNVGGESVFAVPPLALSDPMRKPSLRTALQDEATRLFLERAAGVAPGFALTGSNRAAVVGICERLEGLPLGIELAAARLRTMSPEQILNRLDDRFALLTQGNRSAPKRQQALRWCIGWSYDLCSRQEQALWERLAVFTGGFELDAAEQVGTPDMTRDEVLYALSGLVDKSIVIREETDTTIWFRMLETVRQYAMNELGVSERQIEYMRRHRDWYLELVARAEAAWIGPEQLQWVARLDRETANIRKAIEFSLSDSPARALRIVTGLYLFWDLRGRLGEGRHWCELALAAVADMDATDKAQAIYQASEMAAMQGDFAAAESHISRLRILSEKVADPRTDALLAHAAATKSLTDENGDLARAGEELSGAIAAYAESGDLTLQLDAQLLLGWVYALQGNMAQAAECFGVLVALTEARKESMARSWVMWAVGFVSWRQGAAARAERYLHEGLRLARKVNDPLIAAACMETLAWVEAGRQRHRRAAVLIGAADSQAGVAGSSAFMFRKLLPYREECVRSSRKALGGKVLEVAEEEGGAMGIDSALQYALGEKPRTTHHYGGPVTLTKRERQVAALVAQGMTNREIATRLTISPRTAEGHVDHILTKLGLSSRAQIAAWAEEPDAS